MQYVVVDLDGTRMKISYWKSIYHNIFDNFDVLRVSHEKQSSKNLAYLALIPISLQLKLSIKNPANKQQKPITQNSW